MRFLVANPDRCILTTASNPAGLFQVLLPCVDVLQALVWQSFKTMMNLYQSFPLSRCDLSPCLSLWFCLCCQSFAPVCIHHLAAALLPHACGTLFCILIKYTHWCQNGDLYSSGGPHFSFLSVFVRSISSAHRVQLTYYVCPAAKSLCHG